MKRSIKFRIVYCPDEFFKFFLQRKFLWWWWTLSGYHRGTQGEFSYDFIKTMNPFALIEHSIPEVQKEYYRRTVPKTLRRRFRQERPQELRSIAGIVDIDAARIAMKEWQDRAEYDIVKPYPRDADIWEWKKE